jgi:hypothetical protein
MALTDFDEYITKLRENRAADFQMVGASGRSPRLYGCWRNFTPTPAVPTASVIRDKDSAESMGPIPTTNTGVLQLLGARLNSSGASGIGVILLDLLVHSGGLDGTITTAQTTNLPTAALTRYTGGVGVMGGIIIYTVVGTTVTTFTVSYTNQAGTPGQISTATAIGSTGFREIGTLIPIPLAAGDTGIRSIESVTLAGTTGTIGNFGVCLFKPLAMMSMESFTGAAPLDMVSTGGVIGQFAEFDDDACLTIATIASTAQNISGAVILNEV